MPEVNDPLVIDIITDHEMMKPLILESGINKEFYDAKLKNLYEMEDRNVIIMQDAYSKLHEYWVEVDQIKRLLPDKTWKMFDLLGGMENTREVVALREALKTLRLKYHEIFKRVKYGKKKNRNKKNQGSPESVSV